MKKTRSSVKFEVTRGSQMDALYLIDNAVALSPRGEMYRSVEDRIWSNMVRLDSDAVVSVREEMGGAERLGEEDDEWGLLAY